MGKSGGYSNKHFTIINPGLKKAKNKIQKNEPRYM
jgi:hypothetical protein